MILNMFHKIKKAICFKTKSLRIHLQSISTKKHLKKLGFYNIEFLGWSPKYLRTYFAAYSNKNKCFIKISNNDSASINEIWVLEKLNQYNFPFVPSIIFLSKRYNKKTLLITSFCEGNNFIDAIKSEADFNVFCLNAIKIVDSFYKIGFVHGDIHGENLIISDKGSIHLIDFGIGTFIDEKQKVDYRTHCGTFFKIISSKERTIRRYDDAYSFVEFIKTCKIPIEWHTNQNFKKLKSLIGRLFFDVSIDNV